MTILGVGHALVDAFAFVGDEVPKALGLHPETFNQVPDYRMRAIVATLKSRNLMAGGSAANTIKLAAQFGLPAFFSSCIGTDPEGQLFERELLNAGVHTSLRKIDGATGTCVTFLTPSQKSTIATFRSASAQLPPDLVSPSALEECDLVLVEGYLYDDIDFMEPFMARCQALGRPVCLSLGSHALQHKEKIDKHVREGKIAHLFAEEEEATALADSDEEGALREFSPWLKSFIINRGDLGTLFLQDDRLVTVPRLGPPSLDPTGSRDGLIAGYIWGLSQGYTALQSCECGTLVASALSQMVGTRLEQTQIDGLLDGMRSLKG